MTTLHFRPHHFLCTLCFQGKGYSPAFIENYTEIVAQLNQDNHTDINVVAHTDSICDACPEKKGARCTTETKIQKLDQAHAAALGIKPGDTLSWKQAQERIAQNIDLPTFHRICDTCEWKAYGICEQVVTLVQPFKQNVDQAIT